MIFSRLKFCMLLFLCIVPLGNVFANCVDLSGSYHCHSFVVDITQQGEQFTVRNPTSGVTDVYIADGKPRPHSYGLGEVTATCSEDALNVVFVKSPIRTSVNYKLENNSLVIEGIIEYSDHTVRRLFTCLRN